MKDEDIEKVQIVHVKGLDTGYRRDKMNYDSLREKIEGKFLSAKDNKSFRTILNILDDLGVEHGVAESDLDSVVYNEPFLNQYNRINIYIENGKGYLSHDATKKADLGFDAFYLNQLYNECKQKEK